MPRQSGNRHYSVDQSHFVKESRPSPHRMAALTSRNLSGSICPETHCRPWSPRCRGFLKRSNRSSETDDNISHFTHMTALSNGGGRGAAPRPMRAAPFAFPAPLPPRHNGRSGFLPAVGNRAVPRSGLTPASASARRARAPCHSRGSGSARRRRPGGPRPGRCRSGRGCRADSGC